MFKKIGKILLILIVIAIVVGYTNYKYTNDEANKYDYTHSIYIKTKSTNGNGINYYEINNDKRIRNVGNFEIDNHEKYLLTECYNSYVDYESGKILNKFNSETCKITDNKNKAISLDDQLNTINNLISNLSNSIQDITIYKIKERYYININFKINRRDVYKLYYYDTEADKLKLIYVFDNETVIGIKEKEPFIFDKEEA